MFDPPTRGCASLEHAAPLLLVGNRLAATEFPADSSLTSLPPIYRAAADIRKEIIGIVGSIFVDIPETSETHGLGLKCESRRYGYYLFESDRAIAAT